MAYTLQLTNRKSPSSVINLIGETYDVQRDKLSLGTARVARVLTESLLRQGFNISAHTHVRRQMSFGLGISADSDENLAAAIQKLNDTLRRTREFSISGSEEQWWLQFNPGVSTGNVYFAIKDGRLQLPPPNYNKRRWELDRPFVVGDLDLITDPLGEGEPVTISSTLMRNDPTRTSAPLNYYTIDSSVIKGDQLAKLKLKIIEQQAMTKLWVGAEQGPTYNDPDDLILTANDFNRDAAGNSFSGNQVTGESNRWSPSYVRRVQGVPNYEDNPFATLIDNSVQNIASGGNRTFTFNNDCQKANQCLFVFMRHTGNTLVSQFDITYDDIPLTKIIKAAAGSSYPQGAYLTNPPTGSKVLKVTNSGGTRAVVELAAIVLDGVNQENPIKNLAYSSHRFRVRLLDIQNVLDLDNERDPIMIFIPFSPSNSSPAYTTNQNQASSVGGSFIGISYTRPTSSSTYFLGLSNSSGNLGNITFVLNAANADTPQIIETSSFSIKKGTYRIMVKLTNAFISGGFQKGGIGYRYGNYVIDPKTGFDFSSLDNLIDVGTIVMPPISAPKESEVANIRLRFNYFSEALANTQDNNSGILLDAVYLLKVDEGSAALKKIEESRDTIDIDTTIDPPSAIILDRTTNVFKSRPEQSGAMIYANPNGTRIFLLGDDEDKTNTWVLSGTIIPQYLHVA